MAAGVALAIAFARNIAAPPAASGAFAGATANVLLPGPGLPGPGLPGPGLPGPGLNAVVLPGPGLPGPGLPGPGTLRSLELWRLMSEMSSSSGRTPGVHVVSPPIVGTSCDRVMII